MAVSSHHPQLDALASKLAETEQKLREKERMIDILREQLKGSDSGEGNNNLSQNGLSESNSLLIREENDFLNPSLPMNPSAETGLGKKKRDLLQLYEQIVQNMPLGSMLLHLEDPGDIESIRVISGNKASEIALGISATEFNGQLIREAFPNSIQSFQEMFLVFQDSVFGQGKSVDLGEIEYEDPKVKRGIFRVTVHPLQENFFFILFENVTEEKLAEKKLLQDLHQLEQKNQELEQFAFRASHDLRTPLRTVLQFIDLLNKQYQQQLDENADHYLKFITESAKRMHLMVGSLLSYARTGQVLEFSQVDSKQVVEEVLQDFLTNIRETRAQVQIGKLPIVSALPLEFRLLFQNLISNAIKFQPEGRVPLIAIDAKQQDGSQIFSVTDNGIGIPLDKQIKIFGMFHRLQSHEKFEGSGIGLAHCKKIVEHHGGEIWVESTPDLGSTFFFSIPSQFPHT